MTTGVAVTATLWDSIRTSLKTGKMNDLQTHHKLVAYTLARQKEKKEKSTGVAGILIIANL